MPAVTDPVALKFVDEQVRPLAESLRWRVAGPVVFFGFLRNRVSPTNRRESMRFRQ